MRINDPLTFPGVKDDVLVVLTAFDGNMLRKETEGKGANTGPLDRKGSRDG